MIATGNHFNFDSLRGAPPFTQGSQGCSYTGAFAFFNNIFMQANSFWRAVPKRTDHAPGGKQSPRRKAPVFSGGFPRLRCVGKAAADKNTDPDLQGKALRSFNVRGVRDGDSGGFWIFGRYPNWTFRDSGHFCPRKIRLRPLLLFETGRIQTATVAQLRQE